MPIYEYECKKCGDIIEAIQGFNDSPLKKHNSCGGKLNKMISLSSFHLKGSGWYDTDYGKKKVKTGTQSDEKSDKTSDDKADGKDSKATESKDGASTSESIKKETKEAKSKAK